jgi:hypothetical protein
MCYDARPSAKRTWMPLQSKPTVALLQGRLLHIHIDLKHLIQATHDDVCSRASCRTESTSAVAQHSL